MERVVVTTSSSGLDYLDMPDNVRVLRLHVEIEDQHYFDGQDITYKQISRRMMLDRDLLPVTRPASIEDIEEFFEDLYKNGCKEVFVVTISSGMSETYQNVMTAKTAMLGRMFVHVFDSKSIAFSEAWQVLEVSKMLKQGKNAVQIAERLQVVQENTSFMVMVEDIRNLVKTKRLSAPRGLIANMMDIKPIIGGDEDGKIITFAKVRRTKNAIKQMCIFAIEKLKEGDGQIYIISTGYDEWVEMMQEELSSFGFHDVPVVPAATVSIAIHGPYALGISVILDC